jgi:isopentenyl-diphosphate delta-isomerase
MDYEYKNLAEIRTSLEQHPDQFSKWFQMAFPRVEQWWEHGSATITA